MIKTSTILCLLLISLILVSCGKNTPNNSDAYLDISFYDKFDNEIDSARIEFLSGKNPINSNFEYINDNQAQDKCIKQIQRITGREYFRLHYFVDSNYYAEHEPKESKNYDRISKIKFECHVKQKDINENCKEKLAEKFLTKELLLRNKAPKEMSKEEANEVLMQVSGKLELYIETGSCNYRILGNPQIFQISELLK